MFYCVFYECAHKWPGKVVCLRQSRRNDSVSRCEGLAGKIQHVGAGFMWAQYTVNGWGRMCKVIHFIILCSIVWQPNCSLETFATCFTVNETCVCVTCTKGMSMHSARKATWVWTESAGGEFQLLRVFPSFDFYSIKSNFFPFQPLGFLKGTHTAFKLASTDFMVKTMTYVHCQICVWFGFA